MSSTEEDIESAIDICLFSPGYDFRDSCDYVGENSEKNESGNVI